MAEFTLISGNEELKTLIHSDNNNTCFNLVTKQSHKYSMSIKRQSTGSNMIDNLLSFGNNQYQTHLSVLKQSMLLCYTLCYIF